jgi:hypothetical protein
MAMAAGALFCAGAFAAAQSPKVSIVAKTGVSDSEQTTLTGGVSISVNGVLVMADRAFDLTNLHFFFSDRLQDDVTGVLLDD